MEQLLPSLPVSGSAKAIAESAATDRLAVSATTAARIMQDLKEAANLGTREEQFQKIQSYFDSIHQVDPDALTDVTVNEEREITALFVSWGFSKKAVLLVKPVVAIDGSHMVPEGTGTVSRTAFSSFIPSSSSLFPHFLQRHSFWLQRMVTTSWYHLLPLLSKLSLRSRGRIFSAWQSNICHVCALPT